MSSAIPSVSAIGRTNLILAAAAAIFLAAFASYNAATGCLLGAAVVIANLYALSSLGRVVVNASGGGPTAYWAGVLAIPLKLFLIVGLVWMLFKRVHVDALGFGAGVLTQLLAILIETWRASKSAARQGAGA